MARVLGKSQEELGDVAKVLRGGPTSSLRQPEAFGRRHFWLRV